MEALGKPFTVTLLRVHLYGRTRVSSERQLYIDISSVFRILSCINTKYLLVCFRFRFGTLKCLVVWLSCVLCFMRSNCSTDCKNTAGVALYLFQIDNTFYSRLNINTI